MGSSGAVHCFEPGAYAFKKLQERVGTLAIPSVHLNNLAVGDRHGLTEFYVYPESHSSWNSLRRLPLEYHGIELKPVEVTSVSITTLDSYCSSYSVGHIDLLKLDLEGSELQALRGAKEMFLQRLVTNCLLEFGQTSFDQGNNPKDQRRHCAVCDAPCR